MRGRAADRFGRFVSWLSTIGITLGVMALVTVLSVMNGFERELQNNILGLMPQAVLSSNNGSVNPQQLPESAAKLQGVTRVAPLTTGDVVLQSARSVAVGVMLGIDPAQKDPLTPFLVNVKQTDLEAGKYNVILGEQLAGGIEVICNGHVGIILLVHFFELVHGLRHGGGGKHDQLYRLIRGLLCGVVPGLGIAGGIGIAVGFGAAGGEGQGQAQGQQQGQILFHVGSSFLIRWKIYLGFTE